MDNELDLDLDKIESDAEKQLEVKNRYKQLSEKVIQGKKENEELTSAKEALEKEKAETAKERDFFKDFSKHSSKYSQASEYQDKIWEKVKGGYSVEDAIVSTLAKEGKLGTKAPEAPIAAGGSASNQIGDLGVKSLKDMTTAEKLAQLMELEKKGDISI